jgi:hypothetical protein
MSNSIERNQSMKPRNAYEFGRELCDKQAKEGFGPNELLDEIVSAHMGKHKGQAREIWNGYYDCAARHEAESEVKHLNGK